LNRWERCCDEADDLDTEIERVLRRYQVPADEARELRLCALRNNRRHDENRSLLSLAVSYLNGGEEARANYFSEISRKERRHREVGYPTLNEVRARPG
jgi:hypothetical protein